ncbi:MAG TPA: 8-oxo-dGTP diphosphatase MutT [Chloroflexia bacterium]|nr:8-oxo-dGTP diphosphatase MutT [Chloroflexia bacterium]
MADSPAQRITVVAAIIRQAGRILIVQRPDSAAMGGLWEFPGGKLEHGETPEAALARELIEELALAVAVTDLYHTTDHTYPDGPAVRLLFYHCRILAGTPQLLWGQAYRWVAPADLPGYAYPAADQEVVMRLAAG